METAELILRTLDRHLSGPAEIRLLGGAALVLGYGLSRGTEDADLLVDDDELRFLVDQRDFGSALEETNRELEPHGLYVSHLWGPEQQILTPEWRSSCRPAPRPTGLSNLRVTVLGPLDLIVSKLCRADEGDLSDIRYLIEHERLSSDAVADALERAHVPEPFADVYPANRRKVEALLESPHR